MTYISSPLSQKQEVNSAMAGMLPLYSAHSSVDNSPFDWKSSINVPKQLSNMAHDRTKYWYHISILHQLFYSVWSWIFGLFDRIETLWYLLASTECFFNVITHVCIGLKLNCSLTLIEWTLQTYKVILFKYDWYCKTTSKNFSPTSTPIYLRS